MPPVPPVSVPALPFRLSPRGERAVRAVLVLGAIVGALLGVETLILHLSTDPFVDGRIYYDAGARLNAGLPLYGVGSDTGVGFYVYPPLLAILFRPLALLPYPAAAVIWQGIILVATVLAVRRVGVTRRTALVLGWLALPVCWALSVSQAEPLVTLLLAIGAPWSVALAGHLKLVPWLVAVFWIGRRDLRAVARFAGWVAVLGLVQLVVEPAGTLAMLRLEWMQPAFNTRNLSPFVASTALWAAAAAIGLALAIRLARGRWGWAAAVALTVLANPRLLVYQLMSLLAALGGPVPTPVPAVDAEP